MSSTRSKNSLPEVLERELERSWTEEEAFAYCAQKTLSHYENFPVGSILLSRSVQPAIHSLYAFMRTADDFADENRRAGDEMERLAWLETWEEMLKESVSGIPSHPIFIALRTTLATYQLPVQWLKDLLSAFKMDVTKRRYATFADVEEYCRYSANPVGRLILTLFGHRDAERYALSDAICTGLQLANHWQDVAVDLKKDRIYLPQEDLQKCGVHDLVADGGSCTPAFKALMKFQVDRARTFFETGRRLPERVEGRLRYELRFTWKGGARILEKIEAAQYDVFHRRPVVTKGDWFKIATLSLLGRG